MAFMGLIEVIKTWFQAIPKWWALHFWQACWKKIPKCSGKQISPIVLEHGGREGGRELGWLPAAGCFNVSSPMDKQTAWPGWTACLQYSTTYGQLGSDSCLIATHPAGPRHCTRCESRAPVVGTTPSVLSRLPHALPAAVSLDAISREQGRSWGTSTLLPPCPTAVQEDAAGPAHCLP